MTPSPLCRKLAVLALAGALLAPALAVGEARRPAVRNSAAPSAASWQVLQHLWGTLVSLWGKNGCRIDPSGRCVPQQDPAGGSGSALEADNGCSLDPSGCAKLLPADNGCSLDPNGCVGALPVDNGCRIDPDGCTLHR